FVAAYPTFWLQSFDSGRRMRLYPVPDLSAPSELVYDDPPIVAAGAVFWALCVTLLAQYSDKRCSLSGQSFSTPETLAGILAVAACGKLLFGSLAEVHKRVALSPDRKLVRPFLWVLLDSITALPVTALNTVAGKAVWFAIFGAIILGLERTGVNLGRD